MIIKNTPLEQFDIISIFNLVNTNTFYLAVTNSTIFTLLIFLCFIFIFQFINSNLKIIPTRWQILVEETFSFSKDLIEKNIGQQGLQFFPFIFFLFSFLILSNLIGMVPYSFTITSHLFVTFSIALMLFIGINIIALKIHKLKFLGFFLPSGVHIALAPLLVPIEIVSYVARVFSLAIRLFANMMSGHTLLKIIAGFAWTMMSFGGIWYVLQLFPLLIIMAVTVLEIGIAILQAYVFTILICLYLNDAIHLAH
uniref:ATP synthase subunit a n=1 Tax=Spongospora subterranea TaxID=70186 RepID=A0A096XTY0_9EUKA|nr:ATP synthase F0 subunit 6 [Spongospora subterranea]AIK19927.1 ATP synthase F0 subunit 6 [Spongospora subterranea]